MKPDCTGVGSLYRLGPDRFPLLVPARDLDSLTLAYGPRTFSALARSRISWRRIARRMHAHPLPVRFCLGHRGMGSGRVPYRTGPSCSESGPSARMGIPPRIALLRGLQGSCAGGDRPFGPRVLRRRASLIGALIGFGQIPSVRGRRPRDPTRSACRSAARHHENPVARGGCPRSPVSAAQVGRLQKPPPSVPAYAAVSWPVYDNPFMPVPDDRMPCDCFRFRLRVPQCLLSSRPRPNTR